ncbi:4-(cytidine 5'-diphospho)-2-C-methyl-D-erythritol kinase [Jiella sonneratiae]|uniref:4-diphosphocytidyl-2-C-methyl-D-erythritol kinase n=1 Tax=Jiella sonneratiae TaxID=2816856 RepID=A0ABS3J5S4_9HYPH|nr:4-(cytidine 5'-diphospho)-2-C-methyl-D-erythritol kinase [Jiella sonneratiae]MBO0904495.1 4-(cytidine 5'-diphospho)-2-C-methyl-D-erythritol kinase [Jiella sonneratiae]
MQAAAIAHSRRMAPAKVNLALHVVGRRDDGYHLLESLVVFDDSAADEIGLCPLDRALGSGEDEAGEESAASVGGPADRLTVSGRFAAGVPALKGNLVLAAIELAREEFARFDLHLPLLDVALTKNLPVAAGIGGGSADAAALLALLAEAAPHEIGPEVGKALAAASLRLGADVPMCLAGRPALVTGIGEAIRPLPAMPPLPMLLVNPGIAVETAAVFRMLGRRDNPPMPPVPADGFSSLGDLLGFLAETRNDLALAAGALAPEVEIARARLLAAGAAFARMSGSGATVFGLFGDDDERDEAARRIAAAEPGWWLSRSPA